MDARYQRLKNWLFKPYPRLQGVKERLLTSVLYGVFVFVFLIFFQPFGISDYAGSKAIYLAGFGCITTGVMLLTHFILPPLLPRIFDADRWSIWKATVQGTWIVTAITSMNYLYWSMQAEDGVMISALFTFAVITPSIGIFPIMVTIIIKELYLSDRHAKNASRINAKLDSEKDQSSQHPDLVILRGEVQRDVLKVREKDIVYIQAQENYCEVHYMDESHLTNSLLRVSLKELETQLENCPAIFRCHRSYLVNKARVSRVSGNARAYTLHLNVGDQELPVSRTRAREYFA